MGCKNQVQAENANALHKNSSDSETGDRLQTFKRSYLADTLGHPVSRNWPSSSHCHLMKKITAMSTPGQDARGFLSQMKRREEGKKRNKR